MSTPNTFCLRNLPFPAKLVVTCFLLAVGGGYVAAMVQLHFQDSRTGEAMPTVHDVVLKFTGKKWLETEPPKPESKFVKLITAPEVGPPFNGSGTMSPAFFNKDDGEFNKIVRGSEDQRARLRAEREGERSALVLWAKAPAEERKKAFEDDHFGIAVEAMPRAITTRFKSPDGAVLVRSIINARCGRCHGKGGAQEGIPLESYEQIDKYLSVPATVTVKAGGDWVKVEEPISLEKLTQSTHAHLLSFAMLFSLTGLVFAFTSYPAVLRCILGPWVLIAIVSDVSLWWLARLSSEWGPYFAMAILGTGGAAGLGLVAQILLSLFNMYSWKGKAALLLVFALSAGAASLVVVNVIAPGLKAKKEQLNAQVQGESPEPAKKEPEPKDSTLPQAKSVPLLQKLMTIPAGTAVTDLKWKGDLEGGMARAFFDKDEGKEYASLLKGDDLTDAEKQTLTAERHGELASFLAWMQSPDAERKKAYDSDLFELPPNLASQPITGYYKANPKAVKVRTMIMNRCAICHQKDGDKDDARLDTYPGILNYLK